MITCTFEDGYPAGLRHVVVDTIVVRGDEVLLVRRAARLHGGGKWAVPGGYADRGETITAAARREVLEETGWEVGELSLLRVLDDPARSGDDRQNISFVFTATGLARVGEPDDESDEQRWFPWSALPAAGDMAFDHAAMLGIYRELASGPQPVLARG